MQHNKKFLLVATVVKLHINVFYLPQLQWLKEEGYEVHVAARNDTGEDTCAPAHCDRFFNVPFSRSLCSAENITAYRTLKKLLQENDYTLVACSTPIAAMLTRIAARRLFNKGLKIIYHAHGFHFYKGAPWFNWWLYYPAERFLSRFTTAIVTLNKEDTQRAASFHAPAYNSLGPGVDIKKVATPSICKNDLRAGLSIPEGGIVVLSVGELNDNKNHIVILNALAKLPYDNVYYIICGEGKNRGRLLAASQRLGLGGRLILAGFQHCVADYYNAADIFAFPSIREGIGQSSIEAMAAGLPLVTSRARGVIEYAIEGETALLCDYNDVAGFSRNLKRLIEDEALRLKLSANGRETAKKYSQEAALDVIKTIYKELI
jgi:glycosyltransferase EpsD